MTRRNDKESEERTDEAAETCGTEKKKSKAEKHVSFPPDEQIVSGFAELQNKTADRCLTLTEVMAAYEQSCGKHQVQPNARVLELLQQGACVGGSVKCLDLKGERLDHRSCEALEAVLKWLHFDFISLQAAQLEENGAASLLDMILYYESTTHLDISDNSSVATSGWRALAHLIKQSVRLSRLDVCNVPLVEYPSQSLSKALLSSRLAVLHLDNAKLSGLPLFTLVTSLKSNRNLQHLHLAHNQLNSFQDSLQLGDLLRFNHTLRTLELSHNVLSDAGLEELCEGIKWQVTGLKVLLLRDNKITTKGLLHLAKALPVLRALQGLDLSENLLGNEGVHMLREPLMANCSLLELGLARTGITCEGAVALAEVLAESRLLQRLDVGQNEVRVGGLMALSLALRINRSLMTLQMDQDPPPEQDEFMMETQISLRSEIARRCHANASRLPTIRETFTCAEEETRPRDNSPAS
ncbi:protein phosphatase 1 regulatory subunit 37 [Eucyclogobius newberryi]|uniref:protein phosphatase 1 regulatory subunit 37 n=1 Tax=Eucyclogobius newberryi TaxID=166745 RepID=UPI003B5BD7D2